MTLSRIRMAAALTAFGAAAAVLAACGSSEPAASSTTSPASSTAASSSAPSSPARFNAADAEFATMMYPHHAQAVEMADMVAGKGASPEVTALAAEIKGAQQPEMDAFTRLLAAWGKPAPQATMHHPMEGMMTAEQMSKLGTLRGAEFDREWLTMMIEHHRGAITMADKELASGTNPEARTIAQDIKASQQAEIDRMQQLLRK